MQGDDILYELKCGLRVIGIGGKDLDKIGLFICFVVVLANPLAALIVS